MLRTSMPQKPRMFSKRSDLMSKFSPVHSSIDMSHIIKTMMKVIKTESEDTMDVETRMQFSKIADAVVRMAEEIRE